MSTKTKMAVLPVNFSVVNMGEFSLFSFKSLLMVFYITRIASADEITNAESVTGYDKLYKAAIDAYNQGRWFECFEHISKALDVYREYIRSYVSCSESCHHRNVAINVEASVELNFFKIALERSDCLTKCRLEKYGSWPDQVSSEVKEEFEKLQPYDYLQICAFKLEKFGIAAAAAYTFLMRNPEHEIMRTNVEYYQSMKEVTADNLVNLEKRLYQVHFEKIKDLYAVEDFVNTVTAVEDAIVSYLQEFRRCEVMCEGPYNHGSSPDFYNAIAAHWVSVLRCQNQCTYKLSWIEGEPQADFFPELYNYLQFAYYQLKNYDMAAQAAATYLLYKPQDADMTKNRAFYISDLGVDPGVFVPLEAGRQHFINEQMRQEMLAFVDGDHGVTNTYQDITGQDTQEKKGKDTKTKRQKGDLEEDDRSIDSNFRDYSHSAVSSGYIGVRDQVYMKELEDFMKEAKLSLGEEIQDSSTLVVDGLLTQDQCEELIQLTQVEDSSADNTRPEGVLPLARAVELTSELKIPSEQMRLYLMASEHSKTFIQKYFNFKQPVYNSHSKLVCQSAGDQTIEEHVLADDCVLQTDGSCIKTHNLESQHTFSAILYLSEDFQGGKFFFANDDLTPKSHIKAKCGRLLTYDPHRVHGVKAVAKGTRCGLTMGFTFSKIEREMAQEEGRMVIQAIHSRERPLKNPILRSLVEEKGYDIVMTESELNGPERFTSDKVATNQQCEALIDLANDGGIVGDGYKDSKYKKSPHTAHEEFVGLTLSRASQAGGVQGDGYLPKKGGVGKLSSPHTDKEVFQGLTVIRAVKLLEEGGVDADSVRLYLELSENSLELVQKYFNLTKPLYFDYTHLVCRTALDESLTERKDLSHPVHSDNCLIQADGQCKRVRPAYIQRDYSAILYLNEDFLGGEFFFAHTNFSIQSTLKPKCGRLVGFNAANYHGVQAVLKGQRCAVAMWYTLDPSYSEAAHGIAWNVLNKLEKPTKPVGPITRTHDVGEL